MARFPSIDETGAFEAPEVQNSIKELVTGSTDGITVDTTVGTRVYVGDTMIHGDTGRRNIFDLMPDVDDFSVSSVNPPTIQRVGNLVTFDITFTTPGVFMKVLELPSGFRPPRNFQLGRNTDTGRSFFAFSAGGRDLYAQNGGKGSSTHIGFSWSTDQSWPSTIPGTPA